MICPFKHPTSKFNINFLRINGGRGKAGQGVKEVEAVIMKNSSDNKMYTPKFKKSGQELTLSCNLSLQS